MLGHFSCSVFKQPSPLVVAIVKPYTTPTLSFFLGTVPSCYPYTEWVLPGVVDSQLRRRLKMTGHSKNSLSSLTELELLRKKRPYSIQGVITAVMERGRRKPHTDSGRSSHSTSTIVTGSGRGPSHSLHPVPFKQREQIMSFLHLQSHTVLGLL